MDGSRRINAIYIIQKFMVRVIRTGRGSVVGTGIACPDVCKAEVEGGENLRFVAKPDKNYRLTGWKGCDEVIRKLVCRLVDIESNRQVSAAFKHR